MVTPRWNIAEPARLGLQRAEIPGGREKTKKMRRAGAEERGGTEAEKAIEKNRGRGRKGGREGGEGEVENAQKEATGRQEMELPWQPQHQSSTPSECSCLVPP